MHEEILSEFEDLLQDYYSVWNCATVKKGYSGTAVPIKKSTINVPDLKILRKRQLPEGKNDQIEEDNSLNHNKKIKSKRSPKRQSKLTELWLENPETEKVSIPSQTLLTVEKVSFHFDEIERSHHGEGTSIAVETNILYLVVVYVPNSGDGLKRLDYRVKEW
jgi:exonuclease III